MNLATASLAQILPTMIDGSNTIRIYISATEDRIEEVNTFMQVNIFKHVFKNMFLGYL